MVLKARPKGVQSVAQGRDLVIRSDDSKDVKLDPTPDSELPQDEMVMILMPRLTFEEFRDLGKEFNLGPNALMSYALSELKKTIEKRKAEDAGK